MRSTDFTRTPAPGPAGAMFVGATHYRSLWTLVTLAPRWRRLLREMKRHRGYVWHKVYWRTPLTLGTIAFFSDADELNKFARGPAHHDLMCWLTDHPTKRARAGFIRIYTASPHGYTNGTWRAEDGRLGHIDTFAPLSTERAAGRPPRPVHHKGETGPVQHRGQAGSVPHKGQAGPVRHKGQAGPVPHQAAP